MAESVIADLMVVLTTRYEAAVAGMAKTGTAGEEMAAKVATASAQVTAESAKISESLAAVGASAETASTRASVALRDAQGRFVSAGTSATELGDQTTTASEQVSVSAAKMAASLERVGIASETAATENKLAMEQMSAQTAALSAKMELASAKAAESNMAIGRSYAKADEASAASSMGQAKNLGMAAVAVAAVGAVSADMAAKYETSTNKLVTSAGESKDALDSVRQGMLSMTGDVGVGAEQLSTAMYKVESAGYHGAAGLGLLKSAEQGAKAEGADGAKVADALSSAMRDYYPHAQSAADVTQYSTDVMSKLIGATSAGKMSFDDLAGSLNSILPVASAANISLTDTLGVLASMTVHGISADQATQNMADAIRHLQAPTQTMSKAMATMGIDSQDVASKLGERGLSGTMQMLAEKIRNAMPPGSNKVILDLGNALSQSTPKVQALGQQLMNGSISMAGFSKAAKELDPISAKQAASFATLAGSTHQIGNKMISGADIMQTYGGQLQKVMGDATGLKVALMTTGENAQYTNDAIKTVGGSTADAAGNVKGWSEVQGTFNQKMAETKASLGALAINLGNALLPVLKPVVDAFAAAAGWLAKHPDLAKALAIAIGVLTIALAAMAVQLWAVSLTPATLIVAAIVVAVIALIAGIVLLVKHWHEVWDAVGKALHAVYTAVIKPVFDAVVAAVKWVGSIFEWLWKTILKPVFDALSFAFRLVAMIFVDVFIAPTIIAVRILAAIFTWLWDHAVQPFIDALDKGWHEVYDNIIKPVGDAIGVAVKAVGDAFTWVYQTLIKPVIDGVSAAWNWLYNNAIKPVSDFIKREWDILGLAIKIFYNDRVQPVIDGVSAAWHWLYDNAIHPVASWISDRVHDVGSAFSGAFDWVKRVIQDVWNFIKPIFDAIGGAISKVSNALGGIGNTISSTFSGIGHFFGFDEGGFVPGAQGAPMLAVVHGGEYVVSNDMQSGRQAIDPKLGGTLVGNSSVRASGTGGGGGGVTVVNVIVQGNVTTERQLIDAVQAGMYQTGTRRPVTFQNYRR